MVCSTERARYPKLGLDQLTKSQTLNCAHRADVQRTAGNRLKAVLRKLGFGGDVLPDGRFRTTDGRVVDLGDDGGVMVGQGSGSDGGFGGGYGLSSGGMVDTRLKSLLGEWGLA